MPAITSRIDVPDVMSVFIVAKRDSNVDAIVLFYHTQAASIMPSKVEWCITTLLHKKKMQKHGLIQLSNVDIVILDTMSRIRTRNLAVVCKFRYYSIYIPKQKVCPFLL